MTVEGPLASPHAAGSDPHERSTNSRFTGLRAGVLGANDGIVSTAGLVVGVAGATAERSELLIAGVAGGLAGALSMAVGEYVSVSTQRDAERSLIAVEIRELEETPDDELKELAGLYEQKGLSPELAHEVAVELTARDSLAAHLDAELHLDPDDLTNPVTAAVSSFAAFVIGACIPLLAILLSSSTLRLPLTSVAVILGVALTGGVAAHIGGAPRGVAIARNVFGGVLVMAITYAVGSLVGVAT